MCEDTDYHGVPYDKVWHEEAGEVTEGMWQLLAGKAGTQTVTGRHVRVPTPAPYPPQQARQEPAWPPLAVDLDLSTIETRVLAQYAESHAAAQRGRETCPGCGTDRRYNGCFCEGTSWDKWKPVE
jgi:hypothetical protein